MKTFSKMFFQKNSCNYLYKVLNMDWYGLKYPKLSSDQNDFDMILRFVEALPI